MREVLTRVVVILAVAVAWAAAVAPQVQWTRTFAGYGTSQGRSVQQTSDGGYIIAGNTSSSDSSQGQAFYLVKTDAQGNVTWERTFGGDGSVLAYCVQQTADGGYIVAGSGNPVDSLTPGIYLLKSDSGGNAQWQEVVGDTAYPFAVGCAVVQIEDGGYVIAATSPMTDSGVLLIKTDSLGGRQWDRRYPLRYRGGDSHDVIQLRRTADKGYIVAAKILLKVDSLGGQQWLRTYSGLSRAYSALQTPDGGYVAAGSASGVVEATAGYSYSGPTPWETHSGRQSTPRAASVWGIGWSGPRMAATHLPAQPKMRAASFEPAPAAPRSGSIQ